MSDEFELFSYLSWFYTDSDCTIILNNDAELGPYVINLSRQCHKSAALFIQTLVIFSNILFDVFRFIFFLFFEDLKFRISVDKMGSAL